LLSALDEGMRPPLATRSGSMMSLEESALSDYIGCLGASALRTLDTALRVALGLG